MDSNYGFLPFVEHDAAAVYEPPVRKALHGRPAEFAAASGCALAWEYSGLASWVVSDPKASFTIEHGRLHFRNPPKDSLLPDEVKAAKAPESTEPHTEDDSPDTSIGPDASTGATDGASASELSGDGQPAAASTEAGRLQLALQLAENGSTPSDDSASDSDEFDVTNTPLDSDSGRHYLSIPATVQNHLVGYIHICCPTRMARSGMVALLGYMLELVDKERQEDSLLEELSASWESLDALFEWTVDMRNLPNRQEMLNRIIERAVAVRPGAQAILWIEDGNQLQPTAWVSETNPEPRGRDIGIVGRALDQKNSLVLRRAGHLSQILDTEPELKTASSVVVVPISTQSQLHGALEVWTDDEAIDFESPQLRLLEALSMQAALVVENDRLYNSQMESERLRQEVDIGSRIQQALLFSKVPERIEGASLASLTLPSQTIDGDFYDIVDHNPHCFDVVVGDVMGKGVPAAILAAAAKSGLFRSLCQLMVDAGGRQIPEPDAIVTRLNTTMARQMMSVDSFASLSYARFNLKTNTVTYVDAGHTKTFHLRVRDHQTFLLQGDNLPLGIIQDEVYQQIAHSFESGDVFVFYSDGITEARNSDGEFYGEYRLYECVQTASDRSPDSVVNSIRESVVSFCGRELFQDDLTCVVVRIRPDEVKTSTTQESRVFTSDLRELARIRQWINDLWLRWAPKGHSESGLYQLVLAVNEVASNIMRHAYGGDTSQRIRIRASVQGTVFRLELAHTGDPFDPDAASSPAFDGSRDGGFGVYIIENSVDGIVYSRNDGDWHTIRIEKSFYSDEPAKD